MNQPLYILSTVLAGLLLLLIVLSIILVLCWRRCVASWRCYVASWRRCVASRRQIRYIPVPGAYNDENNDESTLLLESGSSVPVCVDQHPRPMEDFAAASDDKAGS